jgi:hypothetical protein
MLVQMLVHLLEKVLVGSEGGIVVTVVFTHGALLSRFLADNRD